MYKRIIVPIDNSSQSDEAVRTAASLAERIGSTVVGFHAYAGRLHETRFEQMEPGLPERYQTPEELGRQRSAHRTLISEGLRVISESYLDHAQEICSEREVPYERQLAEGRNYVEILREIDADGYDMAALGALGLGESSRSLIGGVTERVVRRCPIDVMVVRALRSESNGVMAAIDGSPHSFKAVDTALQLGRVLEQPVEVVSAFDPGFHIAAFRSIAGVLSEEGAKIFRFREQQKLHEEIIDKGLERLYGGHLERAAAMAEERGQLVQTTLLAGKPFQRVLDHADLRRPFLLVAGRFGLHRTDDSDIGNTSENLARLAKCSVLIVAGAAEFQEEQPLRAPANAPMPWTEDAEAPLENVPPFARAMARGAIEEYAQSHGYEEVTLDVVTKARNKMGM